MDASGSGYIAGQANGPTLPVTSGAYQTAALGTQTQLSSHLFLAKFSPDGSSLLYCTYLGGSANDTGISIAVDGNGNAVVGGLTSSTDFPVTSAAYLTQNPLNLNQNLKTVSFVSKLSADGSTLLWSTFLPSTGLTDVALDSNANIFALTSPSSQSTVVTTQNAIASANLYRWLGELDPTGASLKYATYVPGLQAATISGGLAIRKDGTVWIAGTGPAVSLYSGGYQPCDTPYPPAMVAVVGIDPVASQVISNISISGNHQDVGTGLQLDAAGNLYVAGYTCSTNFPGINTKLFIGPYPYNTAGFLVKVGVGTGAVQWTVSSDIWPPLIATDTDGNTAMLASALFYFDSSGNQVWTSGYSYGPYGSYFLTMDSLGRIYSGATVGAGAGGWETAPGDASPYATGPQGFMRITPNGGSLTVYPQQVFLDSLDPEGGVLVYSTSGWTLPQPFTVSTTTPWLYLENPGASTTVSSLPRWTNTPVGSVSVAFNGGPLPPGAYDGSFTITSPTFANSPLTVPVHAVVRPTGAFTPMIPAEIAIFASGGGWLTLRPYLTSQGGYGLPFLGKLAITSSTSWIMPTSDGTDAWIDESALHLGLNLGNVIVSVANDLNSPYKVTLDVVEGSGAFGISSLMAAPSILSFLAQTGDSAKHASVALWVTGNAPAPFTATSEASWLQVSPSAGSATSILSVIADPSGLQPGTYSTHIDVVSSFQSNGGARIPVTLNVQNNVPFNVDPTDIVINLAVPGNDGTTAQFSMTSQQTMSYQLSAFNASLVGCPYGATISGAGTTPGLLTLSLQNCTFTKNGWTNLEFVTSGGNVLEVPLALVQGTAPSINPGGIVNGATFAPGRVAPGSIVAIFGTGLSNSGPVGNPAPLPLTGVSSLTTFPAASGFGVFYQSASQWTVQVPTDIAPGAYYMGIAGGNSSLSLPVSFTVAATAPYIFIWGSNHGAIQNNDNSLNAPGNPASAGSPITVYLTGQGPVSPPVPTGQAAPSSPLSYVTQTTTAMIDGSPVPVSFAGLTPGFVGLCQVNLTLPKTLAPGEHNLVIAISGVNTNQVVFDSK